MKLDALRLAATTFGLLFALSGPVAASPEDEGGIEWPEGAEEVDGEDGPQDEPSRTPPATSEEQPEGDGPVVLGATVDTTSPVACALRRLISVPHTVRTNSELSVAYPLKGAGEADDFESLGFDKFEVCKALRGNGAYSEPMTGLECGASSQRLGRMRHSVTLQDAFEVEMLVWVNAATSRSKLVFLVGDKLGVSWGQQIAKVSKSGGVKPLAGKADPAAFRGERLVRIKLTAQDNTLQVRCDGRLTAERTFKPGELQGQFGLMAQGVRVQLVELRIRGLVDTRKL